MQAGRLSELTQVQNLGPKPSLPSPYCLPLVPLWNQMHSLAYKSSISRRKWPSSTIFVWFLHLFDGWVFPTKQKRERKGRKEESCHGLWLSVTMIVHKVIGTERAVKTFLGTSCQHWWSSWDSGSLVLEGEQFTTDIQYSLFFLKVILSAGPSLTWRFLGLLLLALTPFRVGMT